MSDKPIIDDHPDVTPTPVQFARRCLAALIDAADMIADQFGESCVCEDGYPVTGLRYECPMCSARYLRGSFGSTFKVPYDGETAEESK